MDHRRRVLVLLIVAAIVLGACQAAPGTPQAAVVTPAQAGTPVLVASEQPSTPVATASPVQATTVFKSKDPTTLTLLQIQSDPDTLDPAFDYETGGGQVIQNTYDTLIFYNRDDPNSFIPQLATEVPSQSNGGISVDGKTYTFKIRTGVKFHNGDALTPGDVAFTFQRGLLQGGLSSPQWLLFQPILGLAASPSGNNDITDLVDPSGKLGDKKADLLTADPAKLLAACQAVTSAIVADDAANTVTFHLAQSWGPFLATIANSWGSISDKKWIGANGGWDGECQTWQNFYQTQSADVNRLGIGKAENGTGPYLLDHWTPKKELVLKAYDGYWRTTPAWPGGPTGAPRLKTIVLKTSAPQLAGRLAALSAGEADIIEQGLPSDWPQFDPFVGENCDARGACAPAAVPTNPLRVFQGLPAVARTDVFFRFHIDDTGGNDFIGSGKLDGNGVPPDFFSDVHIRRAFNYCFDWATYIKDAMLGEGVQSFDVMLPGEIGYSDQDPHYSFDAARCRSEFQASTWKAPDGKSLWDTGFRMSLPYNTGLIFRQEVAQILSRNFAAINPKFVVQAVNLPWPTFLAAQKANKLPLFVSGWLEDIHDPHNWVVPYALGSYAGSYAQIQGLPPDLVQQLSVLVNQAVQETDPARRAAIYHQFNLAYYAAAPGILLAVAPDRHYEQRWVRGYYYNPIYSGYYFYALSKE